MVAAQSAPQVKAVRLESATADGQTSWQIEPVASWIPQVPGVSGDVPPHIQEGLKYAFDLAQRGATYSAQVEFQSVLDMCAAELDAKEGGTSRRTALREGLTAIEEADDFVRGQSVTDGSVDVTRIASSHRTPLQKQLATQSMNSRAAVQSYYEFAEERLTTAYQGMPYATLALYGLGRTSAALDDTSPQSALKSMFMHHVALRVNPANSLAANELGVLLAHNGHYQEAEQVLRQGADSHATPEIWQNLAVVCDQLGKSDEGQLARQRSTELTHSLAAQRPQMTGPPADPSTTDPIRLASITEPVTAPAPSDEVRMRPASSPTAWKPAAALVGTRGPRS